MPLNDLLDSLPLYNVTTLMNWKGARIDDQNFVGLYTRCCQITLVVWYLKFQEITSAEGQCNWT